MDPHELRRLAEAVREARAKFESARRDVACGKRLAAATEAAEVDDVEHEFVDALLAAPDLLDVYEAVRALGAARRRGDEVLNQMQPSDIAVRCARDGIDAAERAVNRLADRLAADAAGKDGR